MDRRIAAIALLAVAAALAARRVAATPYTGPADIYPPDPRAYFPAVQSSAAPIYGTDQPYDAGPASTLDYADDFNLQLESEAQQPVAPPSPIHQTDFTMPTVNPQANLSAFLKLIRIAESNDNYAALVGGGTFSDFSDHPYKKGWPGIKLPNGQTSAAAGAYQLQPQTWDEARSRVPLPDFSPRSQDIAAVAVLQFPWRQDAYGDVAAGRFDMAIRKLAYEWEAFSKMIAGNYPITLDAAKRIYADAGGTFAQGTIV